MPDALTVLNVIAALPPSVVEQALRNGAIHPDTTLEEAKGLAAEQRAKNPAVPSETAAPNLI